MRICAKCTRSTVLGMELTFSDIQSTFLGWETTFLGIEMAFFREAILRKELFVGRKFLFILCIALFPYYGDSSGAILEVPSEALLHLSVFSRSSVGKIRQGIREVKETSILIKRTFCNLAFFGSS